MGASAALVVDPERVREIAEAIARAGSFAFDLEFVSEARFVPELSLVQIGWGDPLAPEVEALDARAVDPGPILELVADPAVDTITHAARQDLGLIVSRFGVTARALVDTQIAAAFVGLGDQIGYAKLVERMCGVSLDKRQQFTAWLDRPLSNEQLEYALDDVRYLLRAWDGLREELERLGRLAWVREESDALARLVRPIGPPETAYRDLKGWRSVRGRARARLVSLAAWRRREVTSRNAPPSWVLPDAALIEVARRAPARARDLKSIRGIGEGTVRRYGRSIVAALREPVELPEDEPPAPAVSTSERAAAQAQVIASVIKAVCVAERLAPRFVGTRGDAEALARWFDAGCDGEPPALVAGWRRGFIGDRLLAWLRGTAAITVGGPGGAALAFVDCDPLG